MKEKKGSVCRNVILDVGGDRQGRNQDPLGGGVAFSAKKLPGGLAP